MVSWRNTYSPRSRRFEKSNTLLGQRGSGRQAAVGWPHITAAAFAFPQEARVRGLRKMPAKRGVRSPKGRQKSVGIDRDKACPVSFFMLI
jgi:hypothetical protein